MKRVLHVVGSLDRGGIESWLTQVLRHVDRRKCQMDFLVHKASRGTYDKAVEELGARVIPCLSPSRPWAYAVNFARVFRELGPYEVVHSHVHYFSGFVLMLAARCGAQQRIFQCHTAKPTNGLTIRRKIYAAAMCRLIQRFATASIAVSDTAQKSIELPRGANGRWSTLACGVDVKRFEVPADREVVRKELGLRPESLVIGHVGRFVETKNHIFIVEIASRVVEMEPQAMFLLVGDGELRSKIEAEVSRRDLGGHFVFTGERDDVPELLAAMDVFVFPSLYEGLPISLLEAQVAGLYCVASTTITPDGDLRSGGLLRLSVNDSADRWAEAIVRLLRHKGRVAPSSAMLEKISIEQNVKELMAIYEL